MSTYRERRKRRAERRREWGDSRDSKQAAEHAVERQITDSIPLGQPILIGHHSEGKHRSLLARREKAITRSVEHGEKADEHRRAADTIERQLDVSVYDDDHDRDERLQERIDANTSERTRLKAANRQLRRHLKGSPDQPMDGSTLEQMGYKPLEAERLLDARRFQGGMMRPYPLTNLTASIRRDQQRLDARPVERTD